jgi:hypothetical protein
MNIECSDISKESAIKNKKVAADMQAPSTEAIT